jgi:hypothetical protein
LNSGHIKSARETVEEAERTGAVSVEGESYLLAAVNESYEERKARPSRHINESMRIRQIGQMERGRVMEVGSQLCILSRIPHSVSPDDVMALDAGDIRVYVTFKERTA